MKGPSQLFPDLIIYLDNHQKIIGVNSVGEQLLKIKPTDLLGKSVDLLFPPQSSSTHRSEVLKDGRKEVTLRLGNGHSCYAELVVSTIQGSGGKNIGQLLTIRDNTKSRESAFRQQRNNVLKKQNAVLRALQDTMLDLHSSLELDVVLNNVVNRACKLLETSHGYLDILRESGELEPMIGVGALEESLNHKVVKGEGVAGTVWQTGKPLLIENYDTWQNRIDYFKRGVISSIVGMPLILDGNVVGVIGIARGAESKDSLLDDDVSVLRQFADLAVIAIQNARLYAQAQQEIEFRRKTEVQLRNANQILQLQIEQVELLQRQLQELAVRDPLTELHNRRYLKDVLDLELASHVEADKKVALLMMDCDLLKNINDRYGHKAGDDFLVLIADVIKDNIRSGDIACRYGGDEYVVVMNNTTPDAAFERAESLRKSIEKRQIYFRNEDVNISVSIGISFYPYHGSTGEELLHRADQALYEAKRRGKNCVVLFSEGLKQEA